MQQPVMKLVVGRRAVVWPAFLAAGVLALTMSANSASAETAPINCPVSARERAMIDKTQRLHRIISTDNLLPYSPIPTVAGCYVASISVSADGRVYRYKILRRINNTDNALDFSLKGMVFANYRTKWQGLINVTIRLNEEDLPQAPAGAASGEPK